MVITTEKIIENLARIEYHINDRFNTSNLPPVAMGWCNEAITAINELQDKLHRRNMQIRDLKKRLNQVIKICQEHNSDEQAVTDIWNIVDKQV